MSTFMYTANGSVMNNKQRIIEGLDVLAVAATVPVITTVPVIPTVPAIPTIPVVPTVPIKAPTDFFNLAGNLKLAGSMRATNFYKEDGTELQSVVKLGLPQNVYYIDNKLGINQDKPMADLDVKGKARILGELGVDGSMGVSGNLVGKGTGSFSGKLMTEDELFVSKHAGIGGNLGVAGNFGIQGTSTFKGLATAEGDFIANKNAGVRGNLGVSGNFGTQGTATFTGLTTAGSDFIANKNASIRGNFATQGTATFIGLTTAGSDFIANKNASIHGNFATQGTSTFRGIINAENDIIGKSANFTGRVNMGGALVIGGQNIPHPDNTDGAFYRADGQVQIATDDLIRLRHINSKATGIQFDVSEGPGDVKNPNGQMKITRQGIMFGGPNANRQVDSGQISAGLHIPNSLNIVGMSADTGAASRRIDMWAEGGLNVYGGSNLSGIVRAATNVPVTDANGEQLVIGNTNQSNLRLGRHTDYSWIQSHGGKPLKINPLGNPVCIGNTCITEDLLKKMILSSSTTNNDNVGISGILQGAQSTQIAQPLSNKPNYMYPPQDAIIYNDIFEPFKNNILSKSIAGNPAFPKLNGWDDSSFKTIRSEEPKNWNERQLLKIGNKNPWPNGLRVNVPVGKNVIWIMVLSDRWESFQVYTESGVSLSNFASGFRVSNRIYPNNTPSDLNSFFQWMPIPVPGPGSYVICGGNNANNKGTDCWISGLAFSSNPWNHAMNSAVAYHWAVNGGTPTSLIPDSDPIVENRDQLSTLAVGKVYTLVVPIIKSGKNKLLYFVLNGPNSGKDCKITVNDQPIKFNLSDATNAPYFAKYYESQPFNSYVATVISDSIIQTDARFLKVVVDLTGMSANINFREIGTIDVL